MSDQATSVAIAVVQPIVKDALDAGVKALVKKLGNLGRSVLNQTATEIGQGFYEYLVTSYQRCRLFKTILSPSQPLEVFQHYVNVDLVCGKRKITDLNFIQSLHEHKYSIVMGLAGSGKSMLMKYLTVYHFENKTGFLPLFVELRQLNALKTNNLVTFVRTTCCSSFSNLSAERFDLALRSGAFVLILDGFDELNHEFRDDIQQQILNLQKDYPELPIVISSRHDERFNSWSSFYVFKVNALSKQQALRLIDSLDYDKGVKSRFRREVKNKLYASHPSFLSSPLLTTIMLLTYEEFAEIPAKMHSFYGQAFDTLFQKHDAQKEQFRRQTKTGLARDEFRFCFSVFCAITYLEDRFSFTDDELLQASKRSIEYTKQARDVSLTGVSPSDFIEDLKGAICMLQQDGIHTSFVHRSFQEYFAAVFATNLSSHKFKTVLDRYAQRSGDSVIPMAHDMAQEVVEWEWVLPTVKFVEDQLQISEKGVANVASALSKIIEQIHMTKTTTMRLAYLFNPRNLFDSLFALSAIYRVELTYLLTDKLRALSTEETQKKFCDEKYASLPRYSEFNAIINGEVDQDIKLPIVIKIEDGDEWWLNELGMDNAFRSLYAALKKIKQDIERRERRRTTILEDLI